MPGNAVFNGFVLLDGAMADDLSVVNSARVSFGKKVERLDAKDEGLIGFLMRERHGTPFEHNSFRFHVKAPIFVAREWFRHRIGSFNELSGRYSELPAEWYVPAWGDVRTQVGSPGRYTFETVDQETAYQAAETISNSISAAYRTYNYLIGLGVAKELARTVIPVGGMTEFYWTVNARSLMNFLSLRLAESAQLEIRQYAKKIEKHFQTLMPVTHREWVANGRVAP